MNAIDPPPDNAAAVSQTYQWGKRLKTALRAKGLKTADAAREVAALQAARSKSKLSDSEREELEQRMINNFYKYVSGAVDHPRGTILSDIARVTETDETWLRVGHGQDVSTTDPRPTTMKHANESIPPAANMRHATPVTLRRAELPIRGRIMGGREGVTFSTEGSDIVGYIEAPPRLAEVPDAYAVYVVGVSMEPVFRSGYICCVNPHLPPNPGDDVVIQISMDNDLTRVAYIKRFISMNDRELKVTQFNPKKTLTFQRRHVVAVHRVMWSGPPY